MNMPVMKTEIKTKAGNVLVYNGKIWISGSKDKSWMSFNRESGRITDIGEQYNQPHDGYDEVIDLKGCRIFPGFHDSHIHVSATGEMLLNTNLRGCSSIKEMQDRIKTFYDRHPELPWITGTSWEQDRMGRYPTKEDIDTVCPDKPVILDRVCGHVYVVNSKALEIAGINKDTPDPEVGSIDRYPKGHTNVGEPNGIFRENMIMKKFRTVSKEEKFSFIKAGINECIKDGLTSVHTNEEDLWNEYCEMAKNNQLPIRIFFVPYFTNRYGENFPYPGELCGDMLSCDRTKLVADGALGACTAALSRPYKTGKDNYGMLLFKQEELDALIHEANSTGYRLEVHVIGDAAADSVLTAMERAQISPEKRPLLTHCQILREDLVLRMVKIGAIANIQPPFVTTDSRWVLKVLPPELMKWSYAWKSLRNRGIICSGGSDSPVESPKPLIAIYDAIYRPDGDRNSDDQKVFRPEECLSTKEAVDLFTKSGAYAARREYDLGKLLPGYMADFVIIDRSCDPVKEPRLFATAKVAEVWVAGKRIYRMDR